MEQGSGKPAINFTYNDVNGKSVSLSDFKGKVVYVDVWATWCGPCRREFPFLKALEEKYHGNKDIVFIGVSSDEVKNIQKWKDFVAKEQLPGVQLHGGIGGDKDIRALYQISGIPRFLLFDKQGNIVSTDAPRPSSEDLAATLTQLLK
jgi:thiol-disulfide isomerase/thioredoxin